MLPLKNMPSPNFNSRDGAVVSALVLHYTGMQSSQDALDILCDRQAQVSAHYVVDEDGTIYSLVDEADCAWHAGVSYWRGSKNINNISIGIEIVNPGHRLGYRRFPQVQMDTMAELCSGIIGRHAIKPVNVVGHSDVAPLRKIDPGELFDWKWLAGKGIGLWPVIRNQKSEIRSQESEIIVNLAEYGYEKPKNDEELSKTIAAFQRHFRPSNVNGVWDGKCLLRCLQWCSFPPPDGRMVARRSSVRGEGGRKVRASRKAVAGNARLGKPKGKCYRKYTACYTLASKGEKVR